MERQTSTPEGVLQLCNEHEVVNNVKELKDWQIERARELFKDHRFLFFLTPCHNQFYKDIKDHKKSPIYYWMDVLDYTILAYYNSEDFYETLFRTDTSGNDSQAQFVLFFSDNLSWDRSYRKIEEKAAHDWLRKRFFDGGGGQENTPYTEIEKKEIFERAKKSI